MPEHSSISDPYVHEPKGISTAADKNVYVADGAGSGNWKGLVTQGWEYIHNTAAAQSLTASVFTDLINNGLGTDTNNTYALPGAGDVWDTSLNQFDWANAGLEVGDTVDVRIDLTVNASVAGDGFKLKFDMAHGDPSEYVLNVFDRAARLSGPTNVISLFSLYMRDATTLNNPAKLAILSETSGDTVTVNGWFVRMLPRVPRTS